MANGYKNKLFESGFLTYIGVSDEIHKDKMEKMLRSNLKSSNFQIILDNDGHFIEELDSKFLWINCRTVDFPVPLPPIKQFSEGENFITKSSSFDFKKAKELSEIFFI